MCTAATPEWQPSLLPMIIQSFERMYFQITAKHSTDTHTHMAVGHRNSHAEFESTLAARVRCHNAADLQESQSEYTHSNVNE